jgi:uncharacterized protein
MNKVVFFEIPANDLKRAQEFYKTVFGWKIQESGEEFAMVTTVESEEKGAINGDLYKETEIGRHPSVVMDVADIKEHSQKIEAAGGKVLKRQFIEGLGHLATFEDTERNVLGIWQKLAM